MPYWSSQVLNIKVPGGHEDHKNKVRYLIHQGLQILWAKIKIFSENFAENGEFRGREIIEFAWLGSVSLVHTKIYHLKKKFRL